MKADQAYAPARLELRRSLLARESVATILGAVLLVILGLALIVAMFVDVAASDAVQRAFLVILGYFFGQVGKERGAQGADDG